MGSNKNDTLICSCFVKEMAHRLLPFPNDSKLYKQTRNSTESERICIKYIEQIIESDDVNKRLETKWAYIESEKSVFCRKISALFELYLINYCKIKDFELRMCADYVSIVISCWFLRLIGCTFSQIIEENMNLCLAHICNDEQQQQNVIKYFDNSCHCCMVYCVLFTSLCLDNNAFADSINFKLFVLMSRAMINSILIGKNEQNDDKMIKFKQQTLIKYLPQRFKICIDEINNEENDEKEEKDESVLKSFGFIQFYHQIVTQYDALIYINSTQCIQWWNDLNENILKITANCNDKKEKMIKCLQKIYKIICIKIEKMSKQKSPPTTKSKIINKKKLNIKLRDNSKKESENEQQQETKMQIDTTENESK